MAFCSQLEMEGLDGAKDFQITGEHIVKQAKAESDAARIVTEKIEKNGNSKFFSNFTFWKAPFSNSDF